MRAAVIGSVLGLIALLACCESRRDAPSVIPRLDSASLPGTIVVPTLDAPLPPEKNVIWCASFQRAWNELKEKIIQGPVLLKGAEAVSKRLNDAPETEGDLPPGSFYAAAGRVEERIVDRIRKEMAERFPSRPPPEIPATRIAIVAYGYLQAEVKFETPFFQNDSRLLFRSSNGEGTSVHSFGLSEADLGNDRVREQVEVLHLSHESLREGPAEFVLDPCRPSLPSQIVLARVPAEGSLAATIDAVERKIAAYKGDRRLGHNDVLTVPNVLFEIEHRFRDLEGQERTFLNPGFESLWIRPALQTIRFKLDRSGAELSSEAALAVPAVPRHLVFDRPFIVYMKKRGAARPFFAIWVGNGDLLSKF